MFTVTLIAVGRLKEPWLREGLAEYQKRLSAYCAFQVVELPEYRLPEDPSKRGFWRRAGPFWTGRERSPWWPSVSRGRSCPPRGWQTSFGSGSRPGAPSALPSAGATAFPGR